MFSFWKKDQLYELEYKYTLKLIYNPKQGSVIAPLIQVGEISYPIYLMINQCDSNQHCF